MHGLCFRALHSFLCDRMGEAAWRRIATAAGLGAPFLADGFEAFSRHEAGRFDAILAAAAQEGGITGEALLEDLGTWLVSHPSCEGVRRLLRFGGADFAGFLFALDELPGRARLAVEDLDLPALEVRVVEGGAELRVGAGMAGFAALLAGVIRAMADDYGTLSVLDLGADRVLVRLVEADFAKGRQFDLAG